MQTSYVSNDVVSVLLTTATTATVTLVNANAAFAARAGHAQSTFQNVIIISGGFIGTPFVLSSPSNPDAFIPVPVNDVWLSMDFGLTWIVATKAAPWAARFYHNQVSTNAAIYVMNGVATNGAETIGFQDLWQSVNFGQTWTQITTTFSSATQGGAVYLAQAIAVNGFIVSFGGISASFNPGNPTNSRATGAQVSSAAVDNGTPVSTSVTLVNGQAQTGATTTSSSSSVPLWAIIVMAIGGFFLLVLLVAVCVVCGRSSDSGPKYVPVKNVSSPVSSNGHGNFTGDVAPRSTNGNGTEMGSRGNEGQNYNSGSGNGNGNNGNYNSNNNNYNSQGQNNNTVDFRPSEMQHGMAYNQNPVVSGNVNMMNSARMGNQFLSTPGSYASSGYASSGYAQPNQFQGYY